MEDSAVITMDGIGTVLPSWATSQVAPSRAAYDSVFRSIQQKLLPPPAYRTRSGQFVRSRALAQVLDRLDLEFYEERPFDQILLFAWPGLEMKGRITTKEKCPKCGSRFELRMKGLICGECWTRPNRYMVVIQGRRKKDRIFGDKRGVPLSSWEQANLALFDIRRDIEAGKYDPARYRVRTAKEKLFITIGDLFIEKLKRDLNDKHISKDYYDTLRYRYRKHVRPFFAKDEIGEIRAQRLIEFLEYARKATQAPKMFQHLRALVRLILRYAVDIDRIDRVPDFPKVRGPRKARTEGRWLDPRERGIVVARTDPDAHMLLETIGDCGLRPSEGRRLRIKDSLLDLIPPQLDIVETKEKPRTIAVTTRLADRLRPLVEKRRLEVGPAGLDKPLFVTRHGKPFTELGMERRWNRGVERAIQEGALPPEKRCDLNHGCRHGFITSQGMEGMDRDAIARYTGHSKDVQDKHYDHAPFIPLPEPVGTKGAPARKRSR